MNKEQQLNSLSKNFEQVYYERDGTGLGKSGVYEYEYEAQRKELEKKFNFMDHYLRLSKDEKKKILFIGCAKGYEVKYFRDRGFDAYGVDVSKYAIDNVPSDVKDYCFREDICDLSRFKDNEFDVVASFDVLQIVKKDRRQVLFKEVSRITSINLMLRISTLPPWRQKTDIFYDGDAVCLDKPDYWVDEFQKVGKFVMQYIWFDWNYIGWFIFMNIEKVPFKKRYKAQTRK